MAFPCTKWRASIQFPSWNGNQHRNAWEKSYTEDEEVQKCFLLREGRTIIDCKFANLEEFAVYVSSIFEFYINFFYYILSSLIRLQIFHSKGNSFPLNWPVNREFLLIFWWVSEENTPRQSSILFFHMIPSNHKIYQIEPLFDHKNSNTDFETQCKNFSEMNSFSLNLHSQT